MNQEYLKLLSLNKTEGELSFEQCQKINEYLASIEFSSIPKDQYSNIKSYLISSLNMESVESNLIKALENLLHNLN
jgi:hypothetical protein